MYRVIERGLGVLPVVAALACTSNQRVTVSPEPESLATYLGQDHPSDLRVTRASGPAFWLHNPAVAGDSLVGVVGREQPAPRRAIAISDIRALEVPRVSAGRTVGLVGSVAGTAGLVLLLVATAGSEPVY